MVTRALQNQTWRIVGHKPLEAHADLLARTQISARQGVSVTQVFRRAVKHNLTAIDAGARAHVDHAVGGQHHSRVVLDHHQRVARINQSAHGLGDAVHITRVQAN